MQSFHYCMPAGWRFQRQDYITKGAPFAGTRCVEARDSEDRQRSAYVVPILSIVKVAIFAGARLIEICDGKIRQIISFYKDKIYSGNRMIAYCRREICGSTR